MGPDFGPFGLQIAVEGLAEFVDGRLPGLLQKIDFGHPVMRQGAGPVGLQGSGVFLEGVSEFTQFRKLLALTDGHRHADIGLVVQHHATGVDHHAFRLAEGIDGEFRRGALHGHLRLLRVSFGLDAQFHRHAESIQILRDFAHHAESLLLFAEDRIFQIELRSAARFDPFGKEISQFFLGNGFRYFLEIVGICGLPAIVLGKSLERLKEFLVAQQPRGLDDGNGIHGERIHHHVLERRVHGAGAAVMLGPQEFRIGCQSVGDPQMVSRGGRDQAIPPLARHLVG